MERDVAGWGWGGSSCPDFEAMVKSGDLVARTVRSAGRTLSRGVSRQDARLERSLWRTEGITEGQEKQGAQ